jgi:hypothetical protein
MEGVLPYVFSFFPLSFPGVRHDSAQLCFFPIFDVMFSDHDLVSLFLFQASRVEAETLFLANWKLPRGVLLDPDPLGLEAILPLLGLIYQSIPRHDPVEFTEG